MADLPPPINGTEMYLAAVHDRLGEILDRLPRPVEEPKADPSGAVELREPDAADIGDAEDEPLAEPQASPASPRATTARPGRKRSTATKKIKET